MSRGRGPEEFFEVFREVQQGRKTHEEKPARAETPQPEPPTGPSGTPSGVFALSYPALAGVAVAVVLLVAAGYLLGRQHGWRAALRAAPRSPRAAPSSAERAAAQQPQWGEPEFMEDGTVFTLLTLGRESKDRESVEAEALYLDSYGPFRALGVRAYLWRDRSGKYRLCARGLKAMSAAERGRVRDQIRRLTARSGRREYRDADFLAP